MLLSGRPFRPQMLLLALPACLVLCPNGRAQTTEQHPHNEMRPAHMVPLVPADTLHLQAGQQSLQFTAATFRELPHVTVKVHNEHSNQDENYSGVPLNTLLARVGAPLGKELHGKSLADYVLFEAADQYRVVLSLAEADPSFHPGEIIVADSMNGSPLDKDGPFKLIVSEDKRPARWVRNLVWIRLEAAPGS